MRSEKKRREGRNGAGTPSRHGDHAKWKTGTFGQSLKVNTRNRAGVKEAPKCCKKSTTPNRENRYVPYKFALFRRWPFNKRERNQKKDALPEKSKASFDFLSDS
jgi:nitrate reductase beta subunit